MFSHKLTAKYAFINFQLYPTNVTYTCAVNEWVHVREVVQPYNTKQELRALKGLMGLNWDGLLEALNIGLEKAERANHADGSFCPKDIAHYKHVINKVHYVQDKLAEGFSCQEVFLPFKLNREGTAYADPELYASIEKYQRASSSAEATQTASPSVSRGGV
ncbi:MAG: hypothetical protein DHS20C10_06720 [marine bacterium B5-7]|nr:MAG: hypothetical protein DHS20C10_06720 [marine bacterium B5-7]